MSWGTGRAVARIPRVSGGGSGRSGQGAFGNMCRGGRMFNPTKTWRKWHHKINVTQRRYALVSALAASAITGLVQARGHRVDKVPELPLVVSNDIESTRKTQKALEILEAIGAFDDTQKVKDSRNLRRGVGKSRNRRYVQRRGPLVVYSEDNGLVKAFRNIPGVDTVNVTRLNLLSLAPGGHLGRFIVWTKGAFEKLDSLYGTQFKAAAEKTGYHLPRASMSQADLNRIINSDEIQSVIRLPKKPRQVQRKKNALRNLGVMNKLNPHNIILRRNQLKKKAAPKVKLDAAKKAAIKKQKKRIFNQFHVERKTVA